VKRRSRKPRIQNEVLAPIVFDETIAVVNAVVLDYKTCARIVKIRAADESAVLIV